MTGATGDRTGRDRSDGNSDVEVALSGTADGNARGDGNDDGDLEVTASAPPPGPRAVVLRGGVPSAEQAAALAAALLSVQAPATSTSPRMGDWQRAALLEGVGGPAVAQRADLERPAQR